MLKCREVAELASDYLDHNLSLRRRLAMWWHLGMCHRCRALMANLRGTIHILHSKKRAEPDPVWTEQTVRRVCRRLDDEQDKEFE